MKIFGLICLLVLLSLLFVSRVSAQGIAPNSREPERQQSVYSPVRVKAIKSRRAKVTHTKQYEFYERVEKAARERKKMLKILSKAQFSDPKHFGHKCIPKRRAPNKMRYCDECGIRH